MDAIITSLVSQGVAGAMAAAFIYFCWYVLTKTLPEQRKEYFESLERQRDQFMTALKDQRTETLSAMTEHHKASERSLERVSVAVDHMSSEVRAIRADRLSQAYKRPPSEEPER